MADAEDDWSPILITEHLTRLRWSIFDPAGIASIQVVDHAFKESPELTQYSNSHPIALEPVAKTGATQLFITAECLGEYESQWNDGISDHSAYVLEECWDQLLVKSPNGGPLLVRDVIEQLHHWFRRPFIMNRIRESLAWMYNSTTQYFPDGTACTNVGPENGVNEVPEETKIWLDEARDCGEDEDTGAPRITLELLVDGYQ